MPATQLPLAGRQSPGPDGELPDVRQCDNSTPGAQDVARDSDHDLPSHPLSARSPYSVYDIGHRGYDIRRGLCVRRRK